MDDIIMLDDTEFLILKEQVDNGTNYIFAIATDGTNDVVFLKESTIDNERKENIRSLRDKWHRFYLSQRWTNSFGSIDFASGH